MRHGLALWILIELMVSSCGKQDAKVTQEQCSKVADHIADIILEHYSTHPDDWWDGMAAGSADTGLPPTVTREGFKAYLDTPEGKTWLMQRHGQVRAGTEDAIKPCMQKATPKTIDCLLAAKSRDDVTACDKVK